MEFPALKAVVLAAGKGTRMRTDGCDLPKVMRTACGRPLLHYVLGALDFIVKPFKADRILQTVKKVLG